MKITLIAAMSTNQVIGNNGQMPWHISADLKHFKQLTLNKPIIMGRKTFTSIGNPLPNRKNIVLSKAMTHEPDIFVAASITAAIKLAMPSKEVMIIGGAQIYALFMPYATHMQLTHIKNQCRW